MAKLVSIPITIASPAVDDECTQYYLVEWKLTGDVAWSSMGTTDNPIEIPNLAAATDYDIRITRYCCNGDIKTSETTYTTSA